MINSVGRPRIVINGTSLDFLGESFMAVILIIKGICYFERNEV